MKDILSMTVNELTQYILEIREPAYRAKQIYSWLHNKKAASFEEMTDLSKDLRAKLGKLFTLNTAKIKIIQDSFKDNTQKYLLEFANNTIIECVLMTYEYGNTICVSSQDGCKMGCCFCASAINGFVRNLSAGEMLAQIYEVEKSSRKKISRCVIMGQGEPFDNFYNTVKFIEIINSSNGHKMGMRNITVSTCGIIPRIIDFANINSQANLAVSLHAPNDFVRKKIMRIAKTYDFDNLIKACAYYINTTNRRITFEYALISGINDGADHARELAVKLKGLNCHVNIIPLNEVSGLIYKKSSNTEAFVRALQKSGIIVTVRRELGSDIEGACGQLRNLAFKES